MIKLAVAKKRISRSILATLVLAFALSPAVYADTFPYLKVFGGDTWAGGAFESGGLCTPGATYQHPGSPPNNDAGGIITYANGSGGGSSDEFGALSFGSIDNGSSSGTPGGFYSNHSNTSLSFASPGSADGGLFEGSTPPQPTCIPDYYSKLRVATAPAWAGNYNPAVPTQYQSSSDTTLSGATINAGSDMTLFVSGNVWISGNITYAAGYNETNVPKFSLVVKGNIYIEPGVTQLDGAYIAEPTSGTTNGVAWTCHDNLNETTPDGTWLHDNCNNKLTINGALIAEQVNFTRTAVNSGTASNVSAAGSGETATANNASEVINYTPSMVIGGPFFVPTTPTNTLPIQDLISLPPLF